MLGGMLSLCSLAMCLRTISEYRKRSPQMRQCHWSRAKMYGRHSELFGSSLGSGIVLIIVPSCRGARKSPAEAGPSTVVMGERKGCFRNKAICGRGNGSSDLACWRKHRFHSRRRHSLSSIR
jgi:hypothetical protein